MPESVEPALRSFARRLAMGLFLDVWPRWAATSLLAAGLVALVCRMLVPAASPALPWLWLLPLMAAAAALIATYRRAYRPDEVVALADSLSGGHGLLLALHETGAVAWRDTAFTAALSKFELPRLLPWRKLSALIPAAAFFVIALWLPQRVPAGASNALLADEIASELGTTVAELKQQELITAGEEEKLQEEIERIRQSAKERVDASAWEAADAFRESVAAQMSRKQDAAKWAEESLARYTAAAESGASLGEGTGAEAAELSKALEKLAQTGLLAGAPADLQRLGKGGKLPTDPKSLRELQAALAKYLSNTNGKLAGAGRMGKEFGKFDASEFPLGSGPGENGTDPGRGGVTRGRGDADLTWGNETAPVDKFKARALPPGAARSPDDWAPIAELPGAPSQAAELSRGGTAKQYDSVAGQAAWRRNLAPRHQSAVKKYFDK